MILSTGDTPEDGKHAIGKKSWRESSQKLQSPPLYYVIQSFAFLFICPACYARPFFLYCSAISIRSAAMRLQLGDSNGPAVPEPPREGPEKPFKKFNQTSTSLPFGQHTPLNTIGGPTYVTAQTLVQQVAYALSDRLWTYSPETFDLDIAVKDWYKAGANNVYGYPTNVEAMQIRPQEALCAAVHYRVFFDVAVPAIGPSPTLAFVLGRKSFRCPHCCNRLCRRFLPARLGLRLYIVTCRRARIRHGIKLLHLRGATYVFICHAPCKLRPYHSRI